MSERLVGFVCVILLVTAGLIGAEIPQMISYQGKVTDSGGVPVPDGDYQMRFRIMDAPTGGTILWDSGSQTVAVNGGVFNVLLGESPQPAIDLIFTQDYWLLATFEGANQTPRQRLASVGYAYMASGLIAGTEVIGPVDTETNAAIKATNTSTTDITYGVYGSTATTEGFGVVGIQPGYVPETDIGSYLKPGGFFGGNNGVMGVSEAQYGFGVLGLSQATTGDGCGGFFMSDAPSGKGVHGEATATTGTNYGIYGSSSSIDGRGVYGHTGSTNGNTYGIYGQSASTSGRGVCGYTGATTGTTYGVHGQSASTDGTGVYGYASAMTGTTYGGRFESYSTDGRGVYGNAWATTGFTYGVYGETASTLGAGVYGVATATTGFYALGVAGESASMDGRGVYGEASATEGYNYGVWGVSASTGGTGVYGEASATTGYNYGVWAKTNSPSGYAGYFYGDVYVQGNLSKSSGSFVIDHPLDPENKLLRHNFVESPENLLIYRGKARLDERGEAVVEMPDYFGTLAREADATVNLTPVGKWMLSEAWPFGYEWSPERDAFTAYGQPGREIAWMVMAERDDPVIRRLARPVEEEKGPDNKFCDRGKLLDPTAYGYPESMGRDYELQQEGRRDARTEIAPAKSSPWERPRHGPSRIIESRSTAQD